MIDQDTRAAKSFYREVRKFSESTRPFETAIFYWTKPDETWDLTLVSQRVYDNRHEFLAVMAAAGLDSVDQPLTQRQLVLPTKGQLYSIKRKTGFESIPEYRKNGKPTWITGDPNKVG